MCPYNLGCDTPHYMRVTVNVTEALVLHPLLEDRGRITESVRILDCELQCYALSASERKT